ncbi:aldo/keto reductase [Stappia sp. F7233]|uniref:Aldo/keto reductase n=1 Tax=Stappia albiluteola TaxID=2758565 RepID=A0A839AHI0_9HYPH|nr:aldo/keto reductase [Stappia albiluteola]MBA5777969.1 aldo/keto reductase [Stappia albiluteola]
MKTVKVKDTAIPALGLGTWRLSGEVCRDIVKAALEEGWTHLDTAAIYQNEAAVGTGLRSASVDRGAIFVTTKVWYDDLDPERMIRACEESLDRLGLDYVDLYLIHWPNPKVPLKESIAGLMELKERGWIRAAGVSNFPSRMAAEAQEHAEGELVANQVEYHPFLSQKEVLEVCRGTGMALTAYSPIARGQVSEAQVIRDIAKKHGRTESQVALRWLIQQEGVVAIPKTSQRRRLAENLGALDFELTEAEMEEISALGSREGRQTNPDWSPTWD